MRRILLILLITSPVWANDIGLELIPRGRPFRRTFADPREIRMALSFEGDAHIHAAIGNYFSIFAIRPSENPDWAVHFGLEGAGFFTMRQADQRFPLETADGLIGAYLEGGSEMVQAQLRFTHISAHLADGSVGDPIPYSRETVSLRFGYLPVTQVQFYGGLHYLANSAPLLPPWSLQWGATAFLPLGKTKLVPFTGMDFRYRGETEANPSYNLHLGIALNNPPEAYRSFRFFYAYYTGTDPRGQFFQNTYTAHSLGIEMQI